MTAYLLYQIKFRLSRTFFIFFQRFFISSQHFRNFFWPPLLRSSLFSISNRNPFVKNFFNFFFIRASGRPSHETALLVYYLSPLLSTTFFFFFLFFPSNPDHPGRLCCAQLLFCCPATSAAPRCIAAWNIDTSVLKYRYLCHTTCEFILFLL